MVRLLKCRLRWAGQLVRMEEERMAKRVDRLREQARRKEADCSLDGRIV